MAARILVLVPSGKINVAARRAPHTPKNIVRMERTVKMENTVPQDREAPRASVEKRVIRETAVWKDVLVKMVRKESVVHEDNRV